MRTKNLFCLSKTNINQLSSHIYSNIIQMKKIWKICKRLLDLDSWDSFPIIKAVWHLTCFLHIFQLQLLYRLQIKFPPLSLPSSALLLCWYQRGRGLGLFVDRKSMNHSYRNTESHISIVLEISPVVESYPRYLPYSPATWMTFDLVELSPSSMNSSNWSPTLALAVS